MTKEEIIEGLKLLEDNMVYFDELLNDKGEYIDVHELLFEAIEALVQDSWEDCISRKSLKHKLQEHHDFFVNAYGGFSNLPLNDKSRVDEIINCIAMVVNEPSIQPTAKENLVVGDCISRKALIEYANNLKDGIGITANDIARFPSIQPKTELETWEGIHAQVTAPKGTFDKIWNEAEEDNDEI